MKVYNPKERFPIEYLNNVGNDIEIIPASDEVICIVMKFGGSSLADAERITYVSK